METFPIIISITSRGSSRIRPVELLTATGNDDSCRGFRACVVRFCRFGVPMVGSRVGDGTSQRRRGQELLRTKFGKGDKESIR